MVARRNKKTIAVTDFSPDVLERNQKKFGLWLRTRREQLGLSQEEAAKAGHCSDSWLCQLETAFCDCTAIKANKLPKLALAYQLPVLTILDAILGVTGVKRVS